MSRQTYQFPGIDLLLIYLFDRVESDAPVSALFEALASELAGQRMSAEEIGGIILNNLITSIPDPDKAVDAIASADVLVEAIITDDPDIRRQVLEVVNFFSGAVAELNGEPTEELPIPQDGDITNLEQLAQHLDAILKYTVNGGQTWRYTKVARYGPIEYKGGIKGIPSRQQLLPNTAHCTIPLTTKLFDQGMVLRTTTLVETVGLRFSFTSSWDDPPPNR